MLVFLATILKRVADSNSNYLKDDDPLQAVRSRGFSTPDPTPTLLLICRESYGFTHKIYSRVSTTLGVIGVWFSFDQDMRYLDNESISNLTGS